MTSKTILLIDPCSSRLKFIEEINKAGYEPVCVFPYHEYNDSFESKRYRCNVNEIKDICSRNSKVIEAPKEMDELIAQLQTMNVLGVINCSDPAAHISDVIAEKLGCPLNPSKNSNVRMDKYDMQNAIAEFSLRSIRTAVVKTEDDIKKFWHDNDIKCAIVKPAKSGGMKGVHQCRDVIESVTAVYSLLNDTNQIGEKNNKVVIQEYLEGEHFFFNTISVNGSHTVLQTWVAGGRSNSDGTFEITYVSSSLRPSGLREILKYVYNVLDALDFKNGVAQIEVVMDEKGPALVEINPRMMKFYVDPDYQDKIYGNHISDIAIKAMTDPDNFKTEHDLEHVVKPFIIKHLVSTVEGKRYARPAEVLLDLSKSVVKVEMNVPTDDMFDMSKTTHRDLFPGKVQLYDDELGRFNNTLFSIRVIERRYPELFWDTVVKHDDCGYTSDISEVEDELKKGKTVAVLNDLGILELKDGKYSNASPSKKYGCGIMILGGSFKLDERYALIDEFCNVIKDGGVLYALQSSYQNMPYGEAGMETVLNMLGHSVEPPTSGHDTKIKCVIHH